jgi:hypothetical protein
MKQTIMNATYPAALMFTEKLKRSDLTYEHNAEREEDNARDKKKFRVEIATLIVVAIYAGLTASQGCSTQKAAEAAKSAADTASSALDESRKAFRIEQRPYVTLQSVSFDSPPKSDQDNGLSMIFTNSGRSPALKVAFDAKAEMQGKPVEGSFLHEPGTMIAAQEPSRKHYVLHLGRDAIGSDPDGMAFKGTVEYTDIFKECHVTTFCSVYDRKQNVFKFCYSGNDIDPQPCHGN